MPQLVFTMEALVMIQDLILIEILEEVKMEPLSKNKQITVANLQVTLYHLKLRESRTP